MNLNSIALGCPSHLGMLSQPNAGSVPAIAARLIQTRKALGLNQTQLCKLAGIATNTYNQWEKAVGRPDIDEAEKLCAKLGYTLDWIYRGDASGLSSDLRTKLADQPVPTIDPPAPAPAKPARRVVKRGQ